VVVVEVVLRITAVDQLPIIKAHCLSIRTQIMVTRVAMAHRMEAQVVAAALVVLGKTRSLVVLLAVLAELVLMCRPSWVDQL
jgi:hypothetical protein